MSKKLLWRLYFLAGALLITLGLGVFSFAPPPDQTGHAQDGGDDDEHTEIDPLVVLNEDNIKQATVLVMQVSDRNGNPVINCVGSGTIVSVDGLILTNAHNVLASDECASDRLIIALTVRVGAPPVPIYTADIVELSQGFDLAVLRIRTYLDGRVIEAGSLQLPFVELGDSSLITLDNTIYVFGYPDIDNQIVEVQRGAVSGFTSEARVGEGAWIRTSASIPGLMSGGGAYNSNGQLIGIPTVSHTLAAGTVVDCRQIYDTNSDQRIDNSDGCIPVGGPITSIRPIDLARGLVQAASLGIQLGPQRFTVDEPLPESAPTFSNLFFTTGITPSGMPVSVTSSAPDGTSTIYLFFDYHNMVNGMIYELRTTLNGRPAPTYSLPPVTWNGGTDGLWYIGTTVPEWQAGTYEFVLLIEGLQASSKSITVGGPPSTQPQFSDLVFGIENSLGQLVGANYVVPEGNVIRARFTFQNMITGAQWRYRWYIDNIPLAGGAGDLIWERTEPQGTHEISIREETIGFISGTYRLELYIESPTTPNEFYLAALGDFIVAGGAGGANDAQAQIFDNFRFAQSVQANLPLGLVANQTFSSRASQVYVFFNWRQISRGTPWTWRWRVDGEILIEEHARWAGESSGENFYFSLVGNPNLPDATYTFEIEINGIPMTRDLNAKVGLGQLPLETFANSEGIQIVGEIIDAETGEGVEGATFIVLYSDYDTTDFSYDTEQVLGMAKADQRGFFQIPSLIPRGTLDEPILYSIIIRANGYYPLSANGIPVTDATRSPLAINVTLNRD